MYGARRGRMPRAGRERGEIPAAAQPTQSPRKTSRRRHGSEGGSGTAGRAEGMPCAAEPSRAAPEHPAGRAVPSRAAEPGAGRAVRGTRRPGPPRCRGLPAFGVRSISAVDSWCAFVGSLRVGALLPGPEPGGGGERRRRGGDMALFHWHESGGGGRSGVGGRRRGERSGRRRGFLIPSVKRRERIPNANGLGL